MDGVHHPDEVDVERVDESTDRYVRTQRTDAGVGDNDVQLSEFGDRVGQRSVQFCPVADIHLRGDGPPARLLHLQPGLLEVPRSGQRVTVGLDVVADVEEDDVGPLFGQLDGVAAALTARRTGYQNDFVLYSSHVQRAFHSV